MFLFISFATSKHITFSIEVNFKNKISLKELYFSEFQQRIKSKLKFKIVIH
jgi:hypothetical protein